MPDEDKYLPLTVIGLIIAGWTLALASIIAKGVIVGSKVLSDTAILVIRSVLFPVGVFLVVWGIAISRQVNMPKPVSVIILVLIIMLVVAFEIYLFVSSNVF